MNHARDVVQRHMQATQAEDLDGIMAGYTDDALLFDGQGNSYRGHAAIRAVFSEVLEWFSELRPETEVHEDGDVVFVTWRTRREGEADLTGTDTFVIEGERIAIHTGFFVEAVPVKRDVQATETAAMTMPTVVDRYIAAVNDEDWATIATLFTTGAEFRAAGASVAQGPEEIAAHLREVMGALPSHHDEPTRALVSGSVVVVEMTVRGRTAYDRSIEFNAVDVIELSPDASAITRLETWYDTATVSAMMSNS